MELKEKVAIISKYIVYIFFMAVSVEILISNLLGGASYVFAGIIVSIVIIGCSLRFIRQLKLKSKSKQLALMLILCLVIKLFYIIWFHPEPVADYETYRGFASQLANHNAITVNNLYIALFTHVFGYSEFVSWIFKIFGENLYAVATANVLLSTVSMYLIYRIADNIGGESMALSTSLIWIIFPSQSLWNAFVLSEPLYTTILLAFWYLCIFIEKQEKGNKLVYGYIIAGVGLVWYNTIRPVGVIVLIALMIYTIFIRCSTVSNELLLRFLVISFVFIVGVKFATIHVENKIGTSTGGFCWYSVATGMNEESNGAWNELDWNRVLENVNLFANEGADNPAKEAEKIEKETAIEKIINLQSPLLLLKNKFIGLLQKDSCVVDHMKASNVVLSENVYDKLYVLTNGFYMFLILNSLVGAVCLMKNKNGKIIEFILLYAIGLTLGHVLLVEVQPRYHYSILLGFVFAAGYGITNLIDRVENT